MNFSDDGVARQPIAEEARDLARADLELTRDELTVDLAQMEEGKLLRAKVEAARGRNVLTCAT